MNDYLLNYVANWLQKQTNVYLKKIIEQNEEIINLLKKGEGHAQ